MERIAEAEKPGESLQKLQFSSPCTGAVNNLDAL